MIEEISLFDKVKNSLGEHLTANELIKFYDMQCQILMEGYTVESDDDFNPNERRFFRKVYRLLQVGFHNNQSLIDEWETECREHYRKTRNTEQPKASPFDVSNFMMDLSGIHDAKPTPSLFELYDARKKTTDLFLPRGKVAVLASEGGLGKSLIALHLGVSLALDKPTSLKSWCGEPLKPIPKSGKVVLLYAEEDKETCLYRLRQQLAGGTGRVDPDLIKRLNGRLIPVPLSTTDRDVDNNLGLSDSIRSKEYGAEERRERLFNSLEKVAGKDGIDLIVIDPLAQFGGSDFENDNGEASRLMRHLQQLTSIKGNPTVLIVHHSAKSNSKSPSKLANALRGSSAIKDNARWAGVLRRISEDATGESYLKDRQDRGVVELVVAKSNYGPSFLKVRCISHESKIIPIADDDSLLTINKLLKSVEESQQEYKENVLDDHM